MTGGNLAICSIQCTVDFVCTFRWSFDNIKEYIVKDVPLDTNYIKSHCSHSILHDHVGNSFIFYSKNFRGTAHNFQMAHNFCGLQCTIVDGANLLVE